MLDFLRCKKCVIMRGLTIALVLLMAILVLNGCADYSLFDDEDGSASSAQVASSSEVSTDGKGEGPYAQGESEGLAEVIDASNASEAVSNEGAIGGEPAAEEPVKDPIVARATIVATGDIMFHQPQNIYAKQKDGSYDYSESFVHVKHLFENADLAVGNFETVVNDDKKANGYPLFNTPSAILKNLKDIGFDILSHANNHTIDGGLAGVFTTREAMEDVGLVGFGTNMDAEVSPIVTMDVKGIKVAFLAYTYGLNGNDWMLTQEQKDTHINLLDAEKIEREIKQARADGADFVIVYPHWGQEYKRGYTAEQEELGRNMIEWGADAVIGSHPHVVEPAERYVSSDGRTGFIIYSVGNFVSRQVKEVMNGDPYPEKGIAVELTIVKDDYKGRTEIEAVKFHPLWSRQTKAKGGSLMEVFPVTEFLAGGSLEKQMSSADLKRGLSAYEYVMERMHVLDPEIDKAPFQKAE